jgi:hypothetical protein
VMIEWVPLGEGDARIEELARRYALLCPGKPFSLEIILYPPLSLSFREPTFIERYRDVPEWVLDKFREWVHTATIRHGRREEAQLPGPGGAGAANQEQAAVEAAMAYARTVLSLGRFAAPGRISTHERPSL